MTAVPTRSARRLGRDVRGELQRPREIAVRREVVLGEPDVAEAERLGGLGDSTPRAKISCDDRADGDCMRRKVPKFMAP